MSNTPIIPPSEYRRLATVGRRPKTQWIEKAEPYPKKAAALKLKTTGKAANVPHVRPSGRTWQFTYSGAVPSLNSVYAGLHWRKRKALADHWHSVFAGLIAEAQVEPVEYFRVEVDYHGKQDCDNITLLTKFMLDQLKVNHIKDDAPQFWRGGLEIVPNFRLPQNTFQFTLIELVEA